jgi:hypothetical protein
MTFTISRTGTTDVGTIRALAQSLATLTEPDALNGLTSEDLAALVNFKH